MLRNIVANFSLVLALVATGCSSRSSSPSSADNGSPKTNHDILVAPAALPTSITLGDGTSLTGDPIRIEILGGDNPVAQMNIAASAGAIQWTVIGAFDTAMLKTGALVASVTQAPFRPGRASVQRWVSQISTAALSGTLNLVRGTNGVWTGSVTTEESTISATVTGGALVTCFVPANEMGVIPNGGPGPGAGVQMVPDTAFQSAFCSQFKSLAH